MVRKAGVTKTFTKDQEYVQISPILPTRVWLCDRNQYWPFLKDIRGRRRRKCPRTEDRGWRPPMSMGENAEDIDGQVQETPPVARIWVKELNQDWKELMVTMLANTSTQPLLFKRKKRQRGHYSRS